MELQIIEAVIGGAMVGAVVAVVYVRVTFRHIDERIRLLSAEVARLEAEVSHAQGEQ